MAKVKETLAGNMSATEDNLRELGIGDMDPFQLEKPQLLDQNFSYRWCEFAKTPYFKMKKYLPITKEEFDRVIPMYAEWVDGGCHLFKGTKDHCILMRCPKKLFNLRRDHYGKGYKEYIRNDKERLKEIGRQGYRKGDSIKPDDVIVDERNP